MAVGGFKGIITGPLNNGEQNICLKILIERVLGNDKLGRGAVAIQSLLILKGHKDFHFSNQMSHNRSLYENPFQKTLCKTWAYCLTLTPGFWDFINPGGIVKYSLYYF